jgi:hypothetical protein
MAQRVSAGRSSPSTNHAWFCWDRKHHSPPTFGYATIARDTPLLDLAGSAAQFREEASLHTAAQDGPDM